MSITDHHCFPCRHHAELKSSTCQQGDGRCDTPGRRVGTGVCWLQPYVTVNSGGRTAQFSGKRSSASTSPVTLLVKFAAPTVSLRGQAATTIESDVWRGRTVFPTRPYPGLVTSRLDAPSYARRGGGGQGNVWWPTSSAQPSTSRIVRLRLPAKRVRPHRSTSLRLGSCTQPWCARCC